MQFMVLQKLKIFLVGEAENKMVPRRTCRLKGKYFCEIVTEQ